MERLQKIEDKKEEMQLWVEDKKHERQHQAEMNTNRMKMQKEVMEILLKYPEK